VVEIRVEQDLDAVVGVDVVAVGERGPHHVPVRFVGADPEVDRVRPIPHEHRRRVVRRSAVHRAVLREPRKHRRAIPHRLVQDTVDLHDVLKSRDAHVELS